MAKKKYTKKDLKKAYAQGACENAHDAYVAGFVAGLKQAHAMLSECFNCDDEGEEEDFLPNHIVFSFEPMTMGEDEDEEDSCDCDDDGCFWISLNDLDKKELEAFLNDIDD